MVSLTFLHRNKITYLVIAGNAGREVTTVISIGDVRHCGIRGCGAILDLEARTLRDKENGDGRDGIGFGSCGS